MQVGRPKGTVLHLGWGARAKISLQGYGELNVTGIVTQYDHPGEGSPDKECCS